MENHHEQTAGLATRCVHSGTQFDGAVRGVNTPIHTSSAFGYDPDVTITYPRYFNTPNQHAVTNKLCALEHTEAGLLFSSGMAAISTAMLTFLPQGSHVVLQPIIYGGTHNFVVKQLEQHGVTYTYAASVAVDDLEAAIQPNTKVVYIETPSNPLLSLTDVAAVAQMARRHGLITMIDNTFASPINQNPHVLGIDVVLHSGTKYLGGHSDICCGAALGSQAHIDAIYQRSINFGGSLNAQTAYLLERSLKTLSLRVKQQNSNALAVAQWLEQQPLVTRVYYPGLQSHEHHALACQQMTGFGGMLSFDLSAEAPPAYAFQESLKLIKGAGSLGGVETTACIPALTSHRKVSAQQRQELGIGNNLMRLSVGIEEAADLIADLQQALTHATTKTEAPMAMHQ